MLQIFVVESILALRHHRNCSAEIGVFAKCICISFDYLCGVIRASPKIFMHLIDNALLLIQAPC
jgi:hypothetical protein